MLTVLKSGVKLITRAKFGKNINFYIVATLSSIPCTHNYQIIIIYQKLNCFPPVFTHSSS